jgi:hypothetical protein
MQCDAKRLREMAEMSSRALAEYALRLRCDWFVVKMETRLGRDSKPAY